MLDVALETLGRIDGWTLYALLGVLVFGESAALVAIVMPGEIALLVAGALVAQGRVSLPAVLTVAIVAAVGGHLAGYAMGRRYGLRILEWRPLRRYASSLDAAASLVARRGATAVFLGRWTNVTRIAVPLLVGAGRMSVPRFLLFNVLGGAAWAVAFVLLGAAAGASLSMVERTVGHASWWASAAVVLAVVARVVWRRRAAGTGGPSAAASDDPVVDPRGHEDAPTAHEDPPTADDAGQALCEPSRGGRP